MVPLDCCLGCKRALEATYQEEAKPPRPLDADLAFAWSLPMMVAKTFAADRKRFGVCHLRRDDVLTGVPVIATEPPVQDYEPKLPSRSRRDAGSAWSSRN